MGLMVLDGIGYINIFINHLPRRRSINASVAGYSNAMVTQYVIYDPRCSDIKSNIHNDQSRISQAFCEFK